MNKLTVVKSNKIINASYKLSLNEQRLILLAISKVNSREHVQNTDVFEISGKEFSEAFSIDTKLSYSFLQKAAKDLHYRVARIDESHVEDDAYTFTSWVSWSSYRPSSGKIRIKFAEKMIPFLSQIKSNFTQYKLEEIGQFKSIYGIRLFEMMLRWKTKRNISLNLKDFKTELQLGENQYKLFKNFRVRCIEPAVEDINKYSSYQITKVDYLKTGRSITNIEIHFCLKSELEKKKKSKKVNQALSQIREDLDKPKELKKIFSEETQPIFKMAPSD